MLNQTVGELLSDRVTLDLEGIDRLYLNLCGSLRAGQTCAGLNLTRPRRKLFRKEL
jgi:hypothetical protein